MREWLKLMNMRRKWVLAHPLDGKLWEAQIRVQKARMAQLKAERSYGMEDVSFLDELPGEYDDGRELPPQLR